MSYQEARDEYMANFMYRYNATREKFYEAILDAVDDRSAWMKRLGEACERTHNK